MPAGRPKLDVDWKLAENLAKIQCTGEEMAAILGMSYDTLERRIKEEFETDFADWFKQKGAHGKASLRRRQYQAAEAGNATMLIWLGKQWLGQSDKSENTIKSDSKGLVINFTQTEDEPKE